MLLDEALPTGCVRGWTVCLCAWWIAGSITSESIDSHIHTLDTRPRSVDPLLAGIDWKIGDARALFISRAFVP